MNDFKTKIIDYYDNLKNKIDLQTENYLIQDNNNESLDSKYNNQRTRFISEIDKIFKFTLNRFESIKNDEQIFEKSLKNIDEILFDEKFCFYYPENNPKRGLGKLVITNCYINPNIIEKIWSPEYSVLNQRDCILVCLLRSLISTWKHNLNYDIVDLSNRELNKIENLSIQFKKFRSVFSQAFINIDKIICIEKIKKLKIDFESINHISKKLLDIFEHVSDLSLHLNYNFKYEKYLFSNFKNLHNLCITNSFINEDLFLGLERLCKLELSNSKIDTIGLKDLECLTIKSSLKSFQSKIFEGLENLKMLNLLNNLINIIDINTFKPLTNLTCLTLDFNPKLFVRAESLNVLVSLEFLDLSNGTFCDSCKLEDLNLIKLKCLRVKCQNLPVMKHLNLNFLHVYNIVNLDQRFFQSQSNLKAIYYENVNKEVLKNIDMFSFTNTKLKYLGIKLKRNATNDLLDIFKNIEKQFRDIFGDNN
ncbi:unnamed protein product, partial [Brachionus calyciflorus]